jgi:hypothetical protein
VLIGKQHQAAGKKSQMTADRRRGTPNLRVELPIVQKLPCQMSK